MLRTPVVVDKGRTTDRQLDRKKDKQKDRQKGRQKDRKTLRQFKKSFIIQGKPLNCIRYILFLLVSMSHKKEVTSARTDILYLDYCVLLGLGTIQIIRDTFFALFRPPTPYVTFCVKSPPSPTPLGY
jgi:hypothetical protein